MNGDGSCGTYATITTGVGDVASAANNFVHNNGFISGSFAFANNLTINAGSDSGTGTITANGTGAQTYSVAPAAPRTCVLSVNKTSGALTAEVGNTNLLVQGFNQVLGDFSAPSGTFSIGGTWGSNSVIFNHSAGTFSNNNGVVIFETFSNCYYGVFGINVLPTTSFYDIIFNGGASCGAYSTFTIAANDTLEATNTLTLSNGAINSNFISCNGNVYLQSGYDGGNASLVFTGSGNSNIDASGATGVYNGPIVIGKTNASKTVNLLTGLIMNGTSQSLVFSKGRLITTTTNLLEIGDNVTTSGASDSSYVSGPLMKTGNDAFGFPVGSTSGTGTYNYAPIIISAPATTTAQFTAEYFLTSADPMYTVSSLGSGLHHVSDTEYWILDRTTSSANVSVSLTWAARSRGVTVLSDLRVARWNGTQWVDQGNGGTSGSTSAGTVISSGVFTSFSPITLGSLNGNNPLPVELVNFNVRCIDDKLVFKWETASEKNSKNFEVQKSSDGIYWEVISTIQAAGFTKENRSYEYTHTSSDLNEESHYYRLKQTDIDLSTSTFDVIYHKPCNANYSLISLYPNPINNTVWLELSDGAINSSTVKIFNNLGHEVAFKFSNISNNKIQFEAEQFISGIYYLYFETSFGKKETIKFIR